MNPWREIRWTCNGSSTHSTGEDCLCNEGNRKRKRYIKRLLSNATSEVSQRGWSGVKQIVVILNLKLEHLSWKAGIGHLFADTNHTTDAIEKASLEN